MSKYTGNKNTRIIALDKKKKKVGIFKKKRKKERKKSMV